MAFLLSLSEEHPRWWALACFAALLISLVLWELCRERPFLDLRMLTGNLGLTGTYLRCAATYVVFYAITYALPQWLQQSRNLSEARAGLVMLPVAGLGFLTTIWATRLVDRRGLRTVLVTGSAALCVGSAALCASDNTVPLWAILLIATVLGLPTGFNNLGNQTLLYQTAPPDHLGIASGLFRTAQYIGANIAAVLVGMTVGGSADDSGLHLLGAVTTALSLGLLASAALSRLAHHRT